MNTRLPRLNSGSALCFVIQVLADDLEDIGVDLQDIDVDDRDAEFLRGRLGDDFTLAKAVFRPRILRTGLGC